MRFRWACSTARYVAWLLVGGWLVANGPRSAAEEFDALFVMRPDGSGVKELAKIDNYGDLMAPRYSHDGKQIVVSGKTPASPFRDCFVLDADGGNLRKLVQVRTVEWSPDGKQIIFKVSTASPIYAQNLDGTGRTELGEGQSPSWSPDGAQLAVSDRTMVRLIDMVSTEERPVFEAPQENIFGGFAWSPDSKYLAVVSRPVKGKRRQLYVVDTQVDPPTRRLLAEGEMGGHVSFSPDGQQIVFADAVRLRIVNLADKKARTLPGQKSNNRNPAWSPDGQWILFVGSTKP